MKTLKITYWSCTSIIFMMEGVIPALTSQSEMAKEGIHHLQYPSYFGNVLVVFKILGTLALLLPMVPKRIKEWAYAGFTFNFLFASISHGAIDGINFQTFMPLIILGILLVSYVSFYKLKTNISVLDFKH